MENPKSLPEVVHTEKQLLALIHSKGILHGEILELYCIIRNGYEKILLNNYQIPELQETEYHLWKLHYKLIDEFRKRLRQLSSKSENIKNEKKLSDNKDLEAGFKSFLSEAREFYGNLIMKLRKNCGLPAEIFLKKYKPFPIEPTKILACRYTCHRLLICLGDLARYTEIIKKPDASDWSTAALYYLEATRTRPDSGNPHNQLALLATYVGDSFLALYHCVRSLAVKEPFPDASSNLMLIFEEGRSTQLQLNSCQLKIDFLNPSKRISSETTFHENGSTNIDKLENVQEKLNLWPVFVRTVGCLLIRSSSEEFPCAVAAFLNALESLLDLDDTKLTSSLESYRYMGSARKGPYRGIQLVSILIFIVHTINEIPEADDQNSSLTPLALASIFICMGRITERCTRENHKDKCFPLLPSVLVFLEWLVGGGALHTAEAHAGDERVDNAMSYFFGALVDLLDRLGPEPGLKCSTALWEDHELRGFNPLTLVHEKLDFNGRDQECSNDLNQCRCQRVFLAATRIADGSFRKWILYDKVGKVFSSVKNKEFENQVEEVRKEENSFPEDIETGPSPKTQSTTDEEEVILFRPITRRNSAPVYISKATKDPVSPKGIETRKTPMDESLRRAASLSVYQDQEDIDSFSFCSTTMNNSEQNRPSKQNLTTTHHTGPPSLKGWVLSEETQENDREKGLKDFRKEKLSPIEELASSFFSDLSIDKKTEPSEPAMEHISTIVHNSSPYVTPTPSAPLLPDDDPVWLRGNSLIYKFAPVNEGDGILGNRPAGLVDGYPPLSPIGMSSSEWLYHYRNGQNPSNHLPQVHFSGPGAFGNFVPPEFNLYDQWGNLVVSNLGGPEMYPSSNVVFGAEEGKRDRVFVGYQRTFPYVCGVGMDMSGEQPPLLQYLKEKEWQVQPGSQLRGPFMGS